MEKNKTDKSALPAGRYFKYAIGEIVLVVIGILIALSINNWNNRQNDRQLELKYLNGLKADLLYNIDGIDVFMEERKIKYTTAALLLDMNSRPNEMKLETIDSILWQVYGWRRFVPRTNVMDELISSGNLSLIQNDSIKALMQNIHQSYNLIDGSTEHMRREFDFYLYDRSAAIREMFPLLDYKKSVQKQERVKKEFISVEDSIVWQNQTKVLLNDLTFRNGLKFAVGNNNGLYEKSSKLKQDMLLLIESLETEIKK
jgi:hypothetical protein